MRKNVTKAAIYVRVSTQEQSLHGYSIDEQTEKLKTFCQVKDWTIYNIYIDPGFTGSNTDRPALQSMISAAKEKKFDIVLIYKLDRLSRSQKDTMYLLEDVFLANNIDLIALSESFDTSTPFGRAMIGMLSVFAQLERENIKERMTLGKIGRAKSGKWLGSWHVPIGYRYIDGYLKADPYEAEIIKIIFERYASGQGVKAIENYLHDCGYKSSYGAISMSTIYVILHNVVYIGLNNYSGKVYPGIHEPIIDKKLFDKVQKRFENNKANPRFAYNTNNFNAHHIFTGVFRCTCGARMRIFYGRARKSDGVKIKYWGCDKITSKLRQCSTKNRMVRADIVEPALLKEIYNLKLDPEGFFEKEEQDNHNEQEQHIVALNQRIKEIDSQIEKLLKLYTLGTIDFDMIDKQVSELSDEKQKLSAAVEKDSMRTDKENNKLSISEVKTLLDKIEPLSVEEIISQEREGEYNDILKALTNDIVITRDSMEIHWRFS